ncbi:MAG: MFS transporter [Actinomycetota bacterium]
MSQRPDGVIPGTSRAAPPLWLIFAVTITGILANSVLTPNIPDILDEFGRPSSSAGLLVAANPLPGVLMAPIIGVLADRYGRRRVLLPCLAVFGIGSVLAALAPSYLTLVVARVFQGLGGAGLINLAVVLIGDHWTGIDRTRLIGRNSAVLTMTLAITPSIGGLLGEVAGWRWALAIGAVALPLTVVGHRLLPPDEPDRRQGVFGQLRGAAGVLAQPAVLAVMATGVLLFMVVFGVFLTALPVHLEEAFGLSAGARGLVLSSFAIGATIAAFNLGALRARFSARTLVVASSLLIAASSAVIGVASTVVLVVIAFIAYGLGDGAAIPLLQDLIAAAAPTGQRGAMIAAWVSGVRLGQTLGPLAASALLAVTTTRNTILAGALAFVVVAIGLMFAPLPDPSDASDPAT